MEVITGVSARLERERRNERIYVQHRAWSPYEGDKCV